MQMNLNQLRVFYYVARERSITKAAERLFVTQPAVTMQIRAMESGVLFPYVKNVRLYKCPTGVRGEMVTYSIVASMWGGSTPVSGGHDEELCFEKRAGIR